MFTRWAYFTSYVIVLHLLLILLYLIVHCFLFINTQGLRLFTWCLSVTSLALRCGSVWSRVVPRRKSRLPPHQKLKLQLCLPRKAFSARLGWKFIYALHCVQKQAGQTPVDTCVNTVQQRESVVPKTITTLKHVKLWPHMQRCTLLLSMKCDRYFK